MKPLKRKQFRVSNRDRWSRISSALGDPNNEEISVMTNEVGSRIHRTSRIAVIVGTKTRTGDKTRNLLNITLLPLHHLTRSFQSLLFSNVPGGHREEDVR